MPFRCHRMHLMLLSYSSAHFERVLISSACTIRSTTVARLRLNLRLRSLFHVETALSHPLGLSCLWIGCDATIGHLASRLHLRLGQSSPTRASTALFAQADCAPQRPGDPSKPFEPCPVYNLWSGLGNSLIE